MNIIQQRITELKEESFRPNKWAENVKERLAAKKSFYAKSSIEKVFYGVFFNETIAVEIIAFFKEDKERQQNILNSL